MSNSLRSLAAAFALAGAAVIVASPAYAQSSPVLGSWSTTANTPIGELKSTMTFSDGAGGPSVQIEDQPMEGGAGGPGAGGTPEQTFSDVKIDGNAFSFKRTIQSPQGEFALSYSGTVDGDSLTATANSDFGAVDITGARTD